MSRLAPVAFAVLVGSALAAPVPKDFKPNDAKLIVGTWHVDSVHDDGKPCPDYPSNVYFAFDGDGGFAQTATGESNVFRRAYTLDPAHSPKRMTLLEKGAIIQQKWLYAVRGDTLLMGYPKGDAVPDAVGPTKGVLLYTLSRVPAEK